MELKKNNWINFKGTISGGTFFVRTLLIAAIASLIVFVAISGSYDGSINHLSPGGTFILLIAYVTAIVFGLSSTNKRLNALMPDNKILGWVLCFIPFIGTIMSAYLVVGNAATYGGGENAHHNG